MGIQCRCNAPIKIKNGTIRIRPNGSTYQRLRSRVDNCYCGGYPSDWPHRLGSKYCYYSKDVERNQSERWV